jgi:proteasome accessory factor C
MQGDTPIKVVRIFKLLNCLSEFPPKTVERLAQIIDVSPKTIYKDIHIIASLGYDIDKDDQHRYHIKYSAPYQYHLDDAEKKLIIGLVKEAGLNTNTITSITQKLKSKIYPDASNFKIMKQLNVIRILIDAIAQKLPVVLIQYQSTTIGSKKRDRHVLPLYFDEMRMTFTAFDFEKAQAQLFKVSRMKDISMATGKNYGTIPENLPIVDAFGFAGNMALEVHLLLSKRACAILIEEFANTAPYIYNKEDESYPYSFTTKVCGYEGVGRFVLGMMTEIRVIGDDGFKEYLKKKISEMTIV